MQCFFEAGGVFCICHFIWLCFNSTQIHLWSWNFFSATRGNHLTSKSRLLLNWVAKRLGSTVINKICKLMVSPILKETHKSLLFSLNNLAKRDDEFLIPRLWLVLIKKLKWCTLREQRSSGAVLQNGVQISRFVILPKSF